MTDGSGQLKRTYCSGKKFIFYYIGDETGTAEYSGVQLNFTANNTVRVIGVRCLLDATSGNMNTPTTPLDYLSRSWFVTLSTNAGTYTYTPTLSVGDVTGNESQLQVSAFAAGSWTAYSTTVASPSINTTAVVNETSCSLKTFQEFEKHPSNIGSYILRILATNLEYRCQLECSVNSNSG